MLTLTHILTNIFVVVGMAMALAAISWVVAFAMVLQTFFTFLFTGF